REKYRTYKPKTIYSSYGADITNTQNVNDQDLKKWFEQKGIMSGQYYLIVGRFVPENNYLTMISEFKASSTDKDLVIITNPDNAKFLQLLKDQTNFPSDKRIKFVGTVYDKNLLGAIRANAFAYIHGHEVGGTNPSLLEALGTTNLNLLLNVGFNKEVGQDAAVYWNKQLSNLAHVINRVDKMPLAERQALGQKAKEVVKNNFSWDKIISENERLFINGKI
ncbi:glycosyl transferase, partial [Lacticaseibacillus rhamnosus]